MKDSVYQINVPRDSIITSRNSDIPQDYHCTCKYCQKFMGEMYDIVDNKYYSNLARKKYIPTPPKSFSLMHNNPGHFVGYRWAIQNFTQPGDIVFDPTVGTGTAIFEAENNGRHGIGVELEFPDTTRFFTEGRGKVIEGNTLTVNPEDFLQKESISLLINGTPYPTISNISSDVPSSLNKNPSYGDYKHKDNIGKWKLDEYRNRIHEMYTKYIPYIKSKGRLIILIKDLMVNKKPFNLHGMIMDSILENNPNLKYEGFFLHFHCPPTLNMRSYEKKYGIQVPRYQTGVVVRKD